MLFKDVNCSYGQPSKINLYISRIEDILAVMSRNGINECALANNLSVKEDVLECNRNLLDLCKSHPEAIPALTLLPPVSTDEFYTKNQLLDIISENKRLFFKMYPKQHGFIFRDWQLSWVADVLEETGVPLLLSFEEAEARDIAEVKKLYKNMKIIITNTAQFMNRVYLQLCKYFGNVFLDTSNTIEYMGIETFCEELGSEKILFGTNMPRKEPYDNIFSLLYADISQEEKENIAFRNFDKLVETRGRRL